MATITTVQLQEIYRLASEWHDRSIDAGLSGFGTEDVQAMIALVDAFEVLDPGLLPGPRHVPGDPRVTPTLAESEGLGAR